MNTLNTHSQLQKNTPGIIHLRQTHAEHNMYNLYTYDLHRYVHTQVHLERRGRLPAVQ